MAYAILLDLLVFVGMCHGFKTYYMDSSSTTCSRYSSYNTVGKYDFVTVKARKPYSTTSESSTCWITFKSSERRLKVSAFKGWSCGYGVGSYLYVYDGLSESSTQLAKISCSTSYLSTIYTSGRYLTVKLKRLSRFNNNYDFSLTIQSTGTTYSYGTSTVSTIGSVIGSVIGSIVFVIVVVVVVIVWRLSVRRRNLQTRTIVTQGLGSPQVLTAMSGQTNCSSQPYSVAPGTQYPPAGTQYPPPGPQYPPPGAQYPPPGAQYPPPGTQYAPPGAQYPPPGAQYPPPGGQYPPQGAQNQQQPQESPATNTGVDMAPPPYKQ